MMHKKSLGVYLFFLTLVLIFFYKVLFGFLPIPADLLVGGYYPWLDYKWGYSVGVPVKNPALSDVISTAYPWRNLAIDSIEKGELPLWNPYVFSGGPLLANWQSAPFYPLNLLMVLLDHKWGWTFMIILQPLLSMIFMFLLLRVFKISILSSVLGSIVFAFSGYMLIFLEYGYLQAGIWLPLLLFCIEKYLLSLRSLWLFLMSLSIFVLILAGNFQISFYSIIITFLFLIFRSFSLFPRKEALSKTFVLLVFCILGVLLAAFQLIPTIELFLHSIRGIDSNISQQNYGLLPLKNIITFFAPDFYGNPATANFKGFLYHETAGYLGIIPLIIIVYFSFRKKNYIIIFFSAVFLIALLFAFDTFLARLLFDYKIPLLSTSYASRILYLVTFSGAILVAKGADLINGNRQNIIKISLLFLYLILGIFLGLMVLLFLFQLSILSKQNIEFVITSLRNLVIPTLLTIVLILILKFNKDKKIFLISLIVLITLDLFRFGWKYNPFVKADLVYPKTPVIDFLIRNSEYYRIEREKSEILPPNTWMVYNLSSPSGYDPLVYLPYAQFYNIYNQNHPLSGISRYLELGNYNSPILDLLGVKYLVVAKREGNRIDNQSTQVSGNISDPKFKRVFEDKTVVVLENTKVMPRVSLFTDYTVIKKQMESFERIFQGFDFRKNVIVDRDLQLKSTRNSNKLSAQIIFYTPNKIKINAESEQDAILMLTDTYYPGWKAYVNNKEESIIQADGIFRAVVIPPGKSSVDFIFQPESFKIGSIISLSSLFFILFWQTMIKYPKHKNE